MAAVFDLQDFEDERARQRPHVGTLATYFARSYNVPPEDATSIPARGSVITLRGYSGTQTALLQPRVYNLRWGEKDKSGRQKVDIVFYRVRPYADAEGNMPEIGDRRTPTGATQRSARRFVVSSDGTTGVPAIGASFPGDSGLLGRTAVSVDDDTTTLPGLHLHAIDYFSFKAYA